MWRSFAGLPPDAIAVHRLTSARMRDSAAMSSGILSLDRPTPLRLGGFLVTAVGALVAGLGSVLDWVVLGFPGDERGTLDVPVKGADAWEGKVVLAAAVLALVGTLVLRLLHGTDARRAVALGVVTLGALAMALAISVAIRADARFAGTDGVDEIAANLSEQLGTPIDEVRSQVQEEYGSQLRVELGPGVWLTIVGGSLIVVGGSLSLAWARGTGRGYEAGEAGRMSEAPPAGPPGPDDPTAT